MEDNIYEYLTLDHRKVAKLFKLFEDSPTESNQIEIFEMIKKELLLHAQSEQATFYKALEAHPESRPDTLHAEDEHAQILTKLDEISHQTKMDVHTKKLILELKKIVEHHVSEEEGKIFREAKKLLTADQAITLKLKMHDLKGKILDGEVELEAIESELETTET